MQFKLALVVILAVGLLFAWRSWRTLPALGLFSIAAAGLAAILLARNPFLALLAVALALAGAWRLASAVKR